MPAPSNFTHVRRQLVQQLRALPSSDACPCLLTFYINHGDYALVLLNKTSRASTIQGVEKTFNIVWEWVTRPRTEDELQALIDMKCSCSPDDRSTPDHIAGADILALSSFSPGWCIITDCLQPGALATRALGMSFRQLHRRQQWPRSLGNFMPHGDADTLQGVCQWLKYAHDAEARRSVLNALCNMVNLARPLVVSRLIMSLVTGWNGLHRAERTTQHFNKQPGK
jgi:hypothetical protein